MFKELEKLGWAFREYYKGERTATYLFYNKNVEKEIEVKHYLNVDEVYFDFPDKEELKLVLVIELSKIDWKGIEF